MDGKTKKLFFLIVSIAVLSIASTYYKYVVLGDYDVVITEEEMWGEIID